MKPSAKSDARAASDRPGDGFEILSGQDERAHLGAYHFLVGLLEAEQDLANAEQPHGYGDEADAVQQLRVIKGESRGAEYRVHTHQP